MSLPIPNLDDRNFEDLMKEARSLIPVYDREWTNYNPSEPGITLLELFSWLSEMTIYRINQVPEENYRRFLELLGIEYLFRWNEIPGDDTNQFVDFLARTYDVKWVKIAGIEKVDSGKTIKIHAGTNSILLKINDKEDKVMIILDNGSTHELTVKKELRIYEKSGSSMSNGWIFRWDKIPGIDKDRLIDFLIKKDKGSDWIKNASLEKTNGTINFINEAKFIRLQLNEKINKVTVYQGLISATPETKYEFIVNKELKIFETIESDIKRGLESISKQYRAITSEDFEFLANECIESLQEDLAGRAICVNNKDLEYGNTTDSHPGHVSVIIIPDIEKPEFNWDDSPGKGDLQLIEFLAQIYGTEWIKTAKIDKSENGSITVSDISGVPQDLKNSRSISLKINEKNNVTMESRLYASYDLLMKKEDGKSNVYCYTVDGKPSDLLKDQVRKYIDKRKLVTTRLHVVAPEYQHITLDVYLTLKENTLEKEVIEKAKSIIKEYFDPLIGGKDGKGWPLGRQLYPSEIYQLLEGLNGVDHVINIKLNADFVAIGEYKLIKLDNIEVHNE